MVVIFNKKYYRQYVMLNFTNYEKHHLHDYVYKKGESYDKAEIDNMKTQIENLITTSISTAINKLKSETSASIIQFINQQVKNRIGRKTLTVPKTNYQWIQLLHKDNLDVESLENVIVPIDTITLNQTLCTMRLATSNFSLMLI